MTIDQIKLDESSENIGRTKSMHNFNKVNEITHKIQNSIPIKNAFVNK